MFRKNEELENLNELQKNELSNKLLKGLVERSQLLFTLFAIGSIFYGFQSFEVLKKFDPTINLTDNVLPRLLFSTIPCLLFVLLQKKFIQKDSMKVLLWAIGFPVIYLATCMVHVWPMIYSGNHDLYLYFHAANIYCITLSFLIVAPNLLYSAIHLFTFFATFFAPIYLMLKDDSLYANLFINDSLSGIAICLVCSHFLYSLRKKVYIYEMKFKNQVTPFLGTDLVRAISSEKLDKLKDLKTNGIILAVDLRGFTQFLQSYDEKITSEFMEKYHSMAVRLFSSKGGYLHKSSGDGHIFSFGVMDDIDLSDLAPLNNEVSDAHRNKLRAYTNKIHEIFPEFITDFQRLKDELNIKNSLRVGAAAAAGDIKLKVQGDADTKMELDISGEVIVKAARLESYTKLLGEKTSPTSSLLILTEDLAQMIESNRYFSWETNEASLQIRDFPNIHRIFYASWFHPTSNEVQAKLKKSA